MVAQEAKPKPQVLITNASIFDGKSDGLATGMSVLVEGNKIARIAKSITAPAGATVIDAKGRTLMPGLIEGHSHIMLHSGAQEMLVMTEAEAGIRAALRAKKLPTSFDAIEMSSTPVIISHANSRNKFDSNRNVPDDLIKAIAQKGGFIGAVMYPPFIRKEPRPTLDDYIDHIKYLVDLVGPDHVAIGSDYFGGQWGVITDEEAQALYERNITVGAWDKATYPPPPWVYPEGIETPKTLYNLTAGLLRRGFAKDDIRKIWGENWLRVMKQVWGA